jgi:hypothetical protein
VSRLDSSSRPSISGAVEVEAGYSMSGSAWMTNELYYRDKLTRPDAATNEPPARKAT